MENLVCAVGPGRNNHAFAHRAKLSAVLLASAALFLLVAWSSPAQAAQSFPQLSKFCPTGTAGGQCLQGAGLATSPIDGHIFEVDTGNYRVQEFTPWGEFVKSFGWSVVASGPGNKPRNEIQQLSVTATGGSFKLRYGVDPSQGGFTALETAPVPFEPGIAPTAAQIKAALVDAPDNLPGIDVFEAGDLNVSGPAGGPWTIEFVGQYADLDFGGGSYGFEAKGEGLTGAGAAATLLTAQSGGNFEICVPQDGDVCQAGSPGSNPGQFGPNSGPLGVAIDSSGNVYVLDRKNHRVEKYDSEGNFLLMFGGSVNQTTGEDVCTAAQVTGGDLCGAGTVGNPGSGEGEFGPWIAGGTVNLGDYLAVGPDGTIYVGDTNRIQRFGPGGAFQGQTAGAVAGETVQALEVGPQGTVYVTFANPAATGSSKPNVRILDGAGNQVGQLPIANPRGIATDADGNVFVIAAEVNSESTIVGFTAAGVPIDLDPNSASDSIGKGAVRLSTGIAATSPPVCGLASTNLAVSSYLGGGLDNSIFLFGAAPDPSICPQPEVSPTIEAQFVSSADPTSASLRALINPRFWPDTRYYVEYGTGSCADVGGCPLKQPAPPGALLTNGLTNTGILSKAVSLTGLQPGTKYHYRFVAVSGGGDPVVGGEKSFRTPRVPLQEGGCPNDVFRNGASAMLPDCRAYELVSPVDKSNGDVARIVESSLNQADPTGQRVTFSSLRSFGAPGGAPLINQYMSHRQSDGWVTESISPPRSVPSLYPFGGTEANYSKAFSADLCSSWVLQDNEKLLTTDAPPGVPNLYRDDTCGNDGYELITSSLPPGFGPVPISTYYFPIVQGWSDDTSRSVFRANAALAVSTGGPRPPFLCSVLKGAPGTTAYRWLRDGELIGAATQPTYTSVAADVGKTVQCQVTRTVAGRTSLVASESLLVAPPQAPLPANPGFKQANAADLPGAPKITGDPTVGSPLTCEPGPWNGSPTFTYRWFRNGLEVVGATASTYVPLSADKGASIQCRLIGKNVSGGAASFSRSVTVEAALPSATAPPATSGTPEAGQVLTCDDGTWQGAPSFAYQWLRNGAAIGGATSADYTLVAADEGKAVQCQVIATSAEGTVAASSSRVIVAPAPSTAPPARLNSGGITGTAEIGQTLSCEHGTWQGAPSFAYQWLRNGAAIGGATSDEYTLVAADEGKAIQCQLTASNAGGSVVALDATQGGVVYAVPPAAPDTVITTRGNLQLYISSGDTLRLVSVLPNGAAANESSTVGTAWSSSLGANARDDAVYRAVSDDGSRVFWTATAFGDPDASGTGAGKLYLRLNATEPQSAISGGKCTDVAKACTIQVSASSKARFISANPQGSRVVYMTGEENPAVGLELFTGDVDVSGGEPTVTSELVADGVRGVVGVSDDANRIYFVSTKILSNDANSAGDEAVAGQPNLYFFQAGSSPAFVATLAEGDVRQGEKRPEGAGTLVTPVSLTPHRRSSRVTPDGMHMVFTATSSPTGFENADSVSGAPNAEVFLYDAAADGGSGQLLCVSCQPSRGRPAGRLIHEGNDGPADDIWAAAIIPPWSSQFHPSRALSDNGRRVFFDAYDSLAPGDTNGRLDVYQWEAPGEGSCIESSSSYSEDNGGCIRLITSGQSAEDAEFLDATPSGSDVFFITQASLLDQDYGLRDVYDARVNGGFPSPAAPGAGCQGEACQVPPSVPGAVTPPSSSFVGPGNVSRSKPPKRCPNGKRKAKRNGKTVCVKSKKAKGKKRTSRGTRQSQGGAR